MKAKIFILSLVNFLLLNLSLYLFAQQPESLGTINENKINVRTDSRIGSVSLGEINSGEIVRIVEEKFDWYKIILPKRFICYVYASHIETTEKEAKVAVDALNLRSLPSLEAPVIGKAKKGDSLTITGKKEEWFCVECVPYATGWIHKKFIDLVSDKIEQKTTNKKIDIPLIKKKTSTLIGTLSALPPLKKCHANYKLKSGYVIFFLKIEDNIYAEKFLNQEVVVEGIRKRNGCAYLEVQTISFK